jgi:xylulokinase
MDGKVSHDKSVDNRSSLNQPDAFMNGSSSDPAANKADSKHALVIDLGGTGLKAAIVSEHGTIIANTRIPLTTQLLPNGGAEQDAERWWQAAIEASQTVIRNSQVAADSIVAVCCDSQFSVIVPVDKNALPLSKAVHWFDSRGGPYSRKLMDRFPSVQGLNLFKALKWIRITGLAPTRTGVDSLSHMLFVKNEWPDVYRNTCAFLEPMDYLTARLTGIITATQHSVPIMMLTSNRRWNSGGYSEQLIAMAGLDKAKLPKLVPNNGIVGKLRPEIAAKLGLLSSTPVISGLLDNQAALIGAGAVENFHCMIYLGTSLNINAHVPYKKTDVLNSLASIPSCLEGRYMLLCEQGLGGSCLDFFLNNILWYKDALQTDLAPEDVYVRLNQTVDQVAPGSRNVLFLPWLNGSLSPNENKNVRGGFLNISLETTRSDLLRAIMEGVALNSRLALHPVEAFMKRKCESIRLAGGGALSDVWAQIYADVLERPIEQLEDPARATCRGAGLNALAALGFLSHEEIPQRVRVKRVFTPREPVLKLYRNLYRQFRAGFKKNVSICEHLNRKIHCNPVS